MYPSSDVLSTLHGLQPLGDIALHSRKKARIPPKRAKVGPEFIIKFDRLSAHHLFEWRGPRRSHAPCDTSHSRATFEHARLLTTFGVTGSPYRLQAALTLSARTAGPFNRRGTCHFFMQPSDFTRR